MANEKCPVCGMDVKNSIITAMYQGKQYALCCSECKQKFTANPAQYIQAEAVQRS